MNYAYTEKDLDYISWKRIEEYVNKIYMDISNYINNNNLKIKYVVPILRGGGIPAIMLSHKFDVIELLPIQLKYNYKNNSIDTKIDFEIYNVKLEDNECILLVEGNHSTGKTANIAKDMILNKLSKNTKVIYCAITKDYSFKDSVTDVIYSTCGMYTNEQKRLNKSECDNLGIDYNLVSVYPWEDVDEELEALNS